VTWSVRIKNSARKDLRRIDPDDRGRLVSVIDDLAANPYRGVASRAISSVCVGSESAPIESSTNSATPNWWCSSYESPTAAGSTAEVLAEELRRRRRRLRVSVGPVAAVKTVPARVKPRCRSEALLAQDLVETRRMTRGPASLMKPRVHVLVLESALVPGLIRRLNRFTAEVLAKQTFDLEEIACRHVGAVELEELQLQIAQRCGRS
jgi:hypothetical protein